MVRTLAARTELPYNPQSVTRSSKEGAVAGEETVPKNLQRENRVVKDLPPLLSPHSFPHFQQVRSPNRSNHSKGIEASEQWEPKRKREESGRHCFPPSSVPNHLAACSSASIHCGLLPLLPASIHLHPTTFSLGSASKRGGMVTEGGYLRWQAGQSRWQSRGGATRRGAGRDNAAGLFCFLSTMHMSATAPGACSISRCKRWPELK